MKIGRNVLILMAFMALISLNANAQAQLKLGVKGGLNYSSVSNSLYTSQSFTSLSSELGYKPSFHAGLAFQYMMQEFGIESGVYYTLLGGKTSAQNGASEFEVLANPSYIQVPVMMLYKFQLSKKAYFYPTFGLFVRYGIDGKIKQDNYFNGNNIKSAESDYFTDNTNKFDWGPTVGLNLEYSKFVLGLGYEYGVKRVNKITVDKQKNMHNNNLKLSLGYFF